MARKKTPSDSSDFFESLVWDSKANKPKKTSNLTQTKRNKIKNKVMVCEFRGCKNPAQEVHHIDWKRDNNVYSNLIVLCGFCHNNAHGKNPTGEILDKTKLKNTVRNRSKDKADTIKAILKGSS
ncbi:HNH endonuclease signature motif containing protein [Methanocalculus natronophilus]|uniref:HNH endonuclease signature motif containing protein n=1 Tax=Methanocalculus natronophilus TaxID=1262400 RepID=UPI0031B60926